MRSGQAHIDYKSIGNTGTPLRRRRFGFVQPAVTRMLAPPARSYANNRLATSPAERDACNRLCINCSVNFFRRGFGSPPRKGFELSPHLLTVNGCPLTYGASPSSKRTWNTGYHCRFLEQLKLLGVCADRVTQVEDPAPPSHDSGSG